MKYLLALLLGVGLLNSLAQQSTCPYKISGILEDKHTHERLAFASIYVAEINSGALTNDSGYFEIAGLCNDNYNLKIEHIGCHTTTRKVTINGSSVVINIQLDHSAHDLAAVEIAAHRTDKPVGRVTETLEGIALRKTQGEALGNMLSNLSGVNVIQTGNSIAKPVIHGMHSNRVLILNNGIRQEGQQWGAEHAPEIDPFIAKKITVIKGANTIKYGADAIAGVILVEPGELPDSTGISGEANFTGASNGRSGSSSALIEGNLKELRNLKFRIQGTLKRAGDQRTPDYFLSNTGLSEKNYSAALGYDYRKLQTEIFYSQFNTKIGIYTGSHLGNTTDLLELFNSTTKQAKGEFSYTIGRPYQEIGHELLKLKTKIAFNNFNTLSLVYSRQFNHRSEYDRHPPKNDSLAALNKPEFQYFITTHMIDLEYQIHHHHHFEGAVGVSGMYQANTYNGRQFIPNFRNQGVGAFWVEKFHQERWQLEAGLRLDHRYLEVFKPENGVVTKPTFTYTNPSASIAANYLLSDALVLSVFSGTAWRPPAINELFSNGLHHGSATIEVGNKNLRPESNWNNSVSAVYTSSRISGEISLYHNILTGVVNLVPSGQTSLTIRGAFPTDVYVQQNAIFKGIDVSAKLALEEKSFLLFQYNMVRATVRGTKDFLSQIPSDRLKIGLEKTVGFGQKSVALNVGGTYVARQTRYAQQQVITQEDGQLVEINDFAPPPAAYFLLDGSITTELKLGNQPVFVSLSGNNLLNRRYRNYLNRFRYFSDDIGRNIQLKINIPFTIKKGQKDVGTYDFTKSKYLTVLF